jgi:hypothetical protein
MDNSMEEHDNNGWGEYKRRVLFQLEELTKKSDNIEHKLDELRIDMTMLKTKVWAYSIIGGFAISLIFNIIFGVIKHAL